jgi:hypothetical protein
MKDTLLQPQVIAAFVGFVGLMVGVLISFLTAKRQARIEREKLEKILKAEYEKKLIEKRLEAYSSLWRVVSLLSKETLGEKFAAEGLEAHVRNALSELKDWYAAHGLTLSKNAYGRFTRLCSGLDSFLRAGKFDNEADLKQIRRRVWELRQNLRADVQLEVIAPSPESKALRDA